MSEAVKTLHQLILKVQNRKELPNREELVKVAAQLAIEAIEAKRTYFSKSGEPREYKQPEINHACKALELVAQLSLTDKKGKHVEPQDTDISKLAEMGWSVSAKPGGGFELVPVAVPEGERVQ
jgi:hypothetical protein